MALDFVLVKSEPTIDSASRYEVSTAIATRRRSWRRSINVA